jgi:stress-induced-phosphoprotein 1
MEETPTDHTIYGNRSASYHNLKRFKEALEDAETCIELKPDWGKGY